MKRTGKPLDVKTLDALKPRAAIYRVSDGGGLLVEVRPTGAKVWLCRLTVDGKRRDMGLGGYPLVSLAAARAAALAARRLAREGVDPIVQREADAAQRKTAAAAVAEAEARTFKAVAETCITALAPGWKNARTAKIWRSSLVNHVYPVIGDMPVAAVGRDAVLRAVTDVWQSRPQIGRKVLIRVGMVLRYAAAHGWRANDNPADVRILRHAGLPALVGGKKQPSLPWQKAPAFMLALDGMAGLAPLALRFTILTAVRSGEARGARWSEISFDDGPAWTIPGERMKAKKSADVQPHRVPLSPAAVETLARAYTVATGTTATTAELPKVIPLRGDALIFPSATLSTPLSDMALSAVIRRMNDARTEGAPLPWRDPDGRGAVPHGFRATFSTWVDDTRPAEREAAERALAHEIGNNVSAAYRRSDLFDRRAPLMEAWAAHCLARPAPTAAVPLRRRKAG
jgi:integrase